MQRSNGLLAVSPARSVSPSVLVLVLLCGLGTGCLLPSSAVAQRAEGTTNVGLQVGQPGGVSAKYYHSRERAYATLITTDGDQILEFYMHQLRERPMPDSLVHLYAGPGLLLGTRTLDEPPPTPDLGLTVQVGLNFYAERFEVFLHATPVLRVLPAVTPGIGGSVGFRYLLRP